MERAAGGASAESGAPVLRSEFDALTARVAALEHQPREVWHRISPTMLALPVEPLYDLQSAAPLIPMSYEALEMFLRRDPVAREFPRRYRFIRNARFRRYRMLLASEIRTIRERLIRAHHKSA